MITKVDPHSPKSTFEISISPKDTGRYGIDKTDYPYLITNALKSLKFKEVSVGSYTWSATDPNGVMMRGNIPMQMQWKEDMEMGCLKQSPLEILTLHKQTVPITVPLRITHIYI